MPFAKVCITGGAGFLGRAFLRRVYERGDLDWQVTVYSRDEQKQQECRRRYPHARYVLGDVRDIERLTAVLTGHDTVIHAAAIKYIPEAEENVGEAIGVNVDGARSVIRAAVRAGVQAVVGISTDKAVRSLNTYGITKALTERLFTEAHFRYGTAGGPVFATVRYGNVVGSTGSVIPLFAYQLQHDGYVTLTDPLMTRFWMPVDDAIDTVLYALDDAEIGGSIIIPRPRSMQMGRLAAVIAGEAVKVVGIRAGEKEHEELMHATESAWMFRPAGGQYYELVNRAFYRPEFAAALGLRGIGLVPPETLASHSPTGGWVTAAELREWIDDARTV